MKNYCFSIKKIVLLLHIFCFSLSGFTQNNVVKGQVKDSINNPVPLVHVMVLKGNDFIVGTITDSDGNFAIKDVKNGFYDLKIVAMGYSEFIEGFTLEDGPVDFETVQLKPSSITLDGVELVGTKNIYERRRNSLIINVEQNISSSGGSVLNLLGNTAGVSMNQQSGNLSLNGKGEVSIMINGKLSRVDGQALLSLLRSMPASEIKSLEVFNNPPAKYEANGSGGLININTKSKNGNGQGGSVSLMSGYGKAEKTGASSSFHYQDGKLGLFGNYSFNRDNSLEDWGLESEFNNPSIQKSVQTSSLRKPVTVSHSYGLGIDYSLFKSTSIGATLSGYNSKWDMLAIDNVFRESEMDASETLDIETKEINHWNHISGNFHVEQSFGESHQLVFDYDHLYYKDNNPSSYQIDSSGGLSFVEIQKLTPITFDVFNIGYKGMLSKKVQTEFGAKTSFSDFENDITVSSFTGDEVLIDNDLSSTTKMEERIHAIYSSFQIQFGDKTGLRAGLRYEHTDNILIKNIGGNLIKRNYGNLFPNISFSHQINETQRLQINYGRRINRPTFNQLAPFVLFLGPDALYSGNTNLQPSFINKYGIEWGWAGKNFTLEYVKEKGAIIEFQPRLSENGEQYIFKAENMDYKNILSASIGIPLQIAPWWNTENNITFLSEKLRFNFNDIVYNRSKGSLRLNSSQQFSIGKTTKLELSGYYQSATLFGIGTFGSMGTLNLGIQQQLHKNHGTLQMSFNNILASENWKIKTNTSTPFVSTKETYFPESRIVTLTYTKNFGGNKKGRRFKGNSADDEKKRIN